MSKSTWMSKSTGPSESDSLSRSDAQRDWQLLLTFVIAVSLLLTGIGFGAVVQMSTRDTGRWTQNMASW